MPWKGGLALGALQMMRKSRGWHGGWRTLISAIGIVVVLAAPGSLVSLPCSHFISLYAPFPSINHHAGLLQHPCFVERAANCGILGPGPARSESRLLPNVLCLRGGSTQWTTNPAGEGQKGEEEGSRDGLLDQLMQAKSLLQRAEDEVAQSGQAGRTEEILGWKQSMKLMEDIVNPGEGADEYDRMFADVLNMFHDASPKTEEEASAIWEQNIMDNYKKQVSMLPPEHAFDALGRLLLEGTQTSDCTCARCGSAMSPDLLRCDACLVSRALVGRVRESQTVDVRVPEDFQCISAALNKTQEGLAYDDWNQRYRQGVLRLSGKCSWKWELEVLHNMTLLIVHGGSEKRRGLPECSSRWWFHQGSTVLAKEVMLCYEHSERLPYPVGVPQISLELDDEEQNLWLQDKHPRYDLKPELDLVWSVVDCWGDCVFQNCSILAADAIALSTAMEANVTVVGCVVGGFDNEGRMAVTCIDLAGRSRCRVEDSLLHQAKSGGSGIRVMEKAAAVAFRCTITSVDYGVTIDHDGDLNVQNCIFDECTWAAWYVGITADGTRMRVVNNRVQGPGWLDERRPGELLEKENFVNESFTLQFRDWQQLARERFKEQRRDSWAQRNLFDRPSQKKSAFSFSGDNWDDY